MFSVASDASFAPVAPLDNPRQPEKAKTHDLDRAEEHLAGKPVTVPLPIPLAAT